MNPSQLRVQTHQKLAQHQDERWQHELKEMQSTHDLRDIDDDVENLATLFEWHAQEHLHRPKSPAWYAGLAGGTTVITAIFLFTANFIGAITTAFVGGLLYHFAQQKPKTIRYRLLVDGVAVNNFFYHYKDLEAFNIVYEPENTKTVILRSKKHFSPLMHLEIGEASPVTIRDILLEFIHEDREMEEPIVDKLARHWGF